MFPIGVFTAQVYHEGKPAEIIQIIIKADGVVNIDGPRWSSIGLLSGVGEGWFSYTGLAKLKNYNNMIATHAGILSVRLEDNYIFNVTANFPNLSSTYNLQWIFRKD